MSDTLSTATPAAQPQREVHGYVLGVDLAAQQDYTALCLLRADRDKQHDPGARPSPNQYAVVHLERWRNLAYPETCDRILALHHQLSTARPRGNTTPRIVVDATGVGLPVLQLLRRSLPRAEGVLIHGGDRELREPGTNVHRVPKRKLVSHLQVVLQTHRLKIAKELTLAQTLADELRGFRVEITNSGHERYGNDVGQAMWREQDHDDLVLATALAVWFLESTAGVPQVFV